MGNEWSRSSISISADNIREVPEKRSGEHFCGSTLFLFPTCTNEVKGIISEFKSGGAPGEDGIRAEFLKNIREEIAEPLMLLANFCFEAGQFPDILKRGIIKPVYKSGEKTVISNYRPICLTSNISKIIAKLIKVRFVKFLDKYKILSENQFGFRKGKSTEDAI